MSTNESVITSLLISDNHSRRDQQKRQRGDTAPYCLCVGLVSRSVISRQCRPVWLSAFGYINGNPSPEDFFSGKLTSTAVDCAGSGSQTFILLPQWRHA
jgi:hypothetical protein